MFKLLINLSFLQVYIIDSLDIIPQMVSAKKALIEQKIQKLDNDEEKKKELIEELEKANQEEISNETEQQDISELDTEKSERMEE